MRAGERSAVWLLACACLVGHGGMCFGQTLSSAPTQARLPGAALGDEDPFDDPRDWYGLDAPTSPSYELDEIFQPHVAMFDLPLIDGPINRLLDRQRWLQEEYGLRIAAAYTHVFQQATGGPGKRWGSAGDADLMFEWTPVGRGTPDTGRFFFSVEERFQVGDIPPSQLRGELGTLVGTVGAFNDRGLVIRDAFWDQRFFDATLRVLVGRASPDDYVGSHRLQSSNFGFFNGNLAGNVTMAFVGHGPLALVSVHPTEWFYATAGGANGYSTTTQMTVGKLDEWEIYGFGEVGVTPDIPGVGSGRYAITGWNMPGRELRGLPSDWGFSITGEQYFGENMWAYARYGWAEEGITGVQQAWQVAFAIDGLLGSPENATGIGFGWSEPANGDLRNEKSIDVFHRFQLLQHTQFSIGAQMFIDPSNSPDDDVLGVFSARIRLEF